MILHCPWEDFLGNVTSVSGLRMILNHCPREDFLGKASVTVGEVINEGASFLRSVLPLQNHQSCESGNCV